MTQQDILENFEDFLFLGDNDVEHRTKVKELTSQYLLQAEWIYTNHLVFQNKPSTVSIKNLIRLSDDYI